jgi:hypothetical protein
VSAPDPPPPSARPHPILYVLFVLTVLNLGLTAALWLRPPPAPVVAAPTPAPPPLPAYLDEAALKELGERITRLYNTRDGVGLHAAFDPAFQSQVTAEGLTEQLGNFIESFGKIDSARFAGYETGLFMGTTVMKLDYDVTLYEGPFDAGVLRLSMIDRGDHAGLSGIQIKGEEP